MQHLDLSEISFPHSGHLINAIYFPSLYMYSKIDIKYNIEY